MLNDDLRCLWAIARKDLRAYYFKPPNVSWGILFPLAFVLAFLIRDGAALDLARLNSVVPGLLALTLLFGTSSMEAIVVTFEQRIGALERLLLAPLRLPALLAAKLLGGVIFGLATTGFVLGGLLVLYGASGINWAMLLLTLVLAAAAFSALGVLISVSVREVFEAQTLANMFRFPMMFLGGVFVPVTSLPVWLQVVARALPLTYAVEALKVSLAGASPSHGDLNAAMVALAVLAMFTVVFFAVAVHLLRRRVA